jgi:hypothetical protein
MAAKQGMPPEFRALLERFNQLGRLLPPIDDFDPKDLDTRTGIEVVLAEMHRVEAQIYAFLDAEQARRMAS